MVTGTSTATLEVVVDEAGTAPDPPTTVSALHETHSAVTATTREGGGAVEEVAAEMVAETVVGEVDVAPRGQTLPLRGPDPAVGANHLLATHRVDALATVEDGAEAVAVIAVTVVGTGMVDNAGQDPQAPVGTLQRAREDDTRPLQAGHPYAGDAAHLHHLRPDHLQGPAAAAAAAAEHETRPPKTMTGGRPLGDASIGVVASPTVVETVDEVAVGPIGLAQVTRIGQRGETAPRFPQHARKYVANPLMFRKIYLTLLLPTNSPRRTTLQRLVNPE